MLFAFNKRSFLLLGAVTLVGCGAAASLPPENESFHLSNRVSEAIWNANGKEYSGLVASSGQVLGEDGNLYESSITILPPTEESSQINGTFSINVPDQPVVRFRAQVGVSSQDMDAVVFRVYVQNGPDFPALAEVTAVPDGRLDQIDADLSAYRGKHILLILSTGSATDEYLKNPAFWIRPQLILNN